MQSPGHSPLRQMASSGSVDEDKALRAISKGESTPPDRHRSSVPATKSQVADESNQKLKGARLKRIELVTSTSTKMPSTKPSTIAPLDAEKPARRQSNIVKESNIVKDKKKSNFYKDEGRDTVEKVKSSPYLTKPIEKQSDASHPEPVRDNQEQGAVRRNASDGEGNSKKSSNDGNGQKAKQGEQGEESSKEEGATGATKAMSCNWPAALRAQLSGLNDKTPGTGPGPSASESAAQKKKQIPPKKDDVKVAANMPRRIRALREAPPPPPIPTPSLRTNTATGVRSVSVSRRPVPKVSSMAPSTTVARSLSPIRDSAPAPVGKGSRIKMIKEIVKAMPTKPLARLERNGVLTKVAEKKIPGAKVEKSETAVPMEDSVANNIFFPSVPKDEESSGIIQSGNETLQTESRSVCCPTQNQMSDFTVTDGSMAGMSVCTGAGAGGGVGVADIECAEGKIKFAEHGISPNQERTPPDDFDDKEREQEDYVFIEHSDPETEEKEKEKEKITVVDVRGISANKSEVNTLNDENIIVTDAPVSYTLDNKGEETIENCVIIEHSEITGSNTDPADNDYDVDENSFEVDNEHEIEKEVQSEKEIGTETEKVESRKDSAKNGSTDDVNKVNEKSSSTLVSPRPLNVDESKDKTAPNDNDVDNLSRTSASIASMSSHDEIKSRFESLDGSHSDESCVVECPLVEGLGQEHAFKRRKSSIQPRLSYEDLRIFTVPIVEGMDGEEEDKMSTTTGSSDTGRDQDSVGGENGRGKSEEGGEDDTSEAGVDGDDKVGTPADEENDYDDKEEFEVEGDEVEVENELEQSGQLFKSHCPSPCGKAESGQELGSGILNQESITKNTRELNVVNRISSENNGNINESISENETLDGESRKTQEKRKNVVQDLSSSVLNKNSGRLEVLESKSSVNEGGKNKDTALVTALSPRLMAKLIPNKTKEKGIEGEKEEETDLLDTTRTDKEYIENTPRENLIISFATLSLKSTGKSDILNSLSRSFDHGVDASDLVPCAVAESNSRISSRRNSATGRRKNSAPDALVVEGMGLQDEIHTGDVTMERRKSLQGLVDLRMETVPLVESEEENAAQDQLGDNHKYLLFKNPSADFSVPVFQHGYSIKEDDENSEDESQEGRSAKRMSVAERARAAKVELDKESAKSLGENLADSTKSEMSDLSIQAILESPTAVPAGERKLSSSQEEYFQDFNSAKVVADYVSELLRNGVKDMAVLVINSELRGKEKGKMANKIPIETRDSFNGNIFVSDCVNTAKSNVAHRRASEEEKLSEYSQELDEYSH